jgi:UDP-GlcNAc:undecaprenyl-phosphate GlcNAc-1-phosphate transferase
LGVAGTALVRRLALHLGIVSQPNPIVAQHTRPVAYLGGLGVAAAAGFAYALARAANVLSPALSQAPAGEHALIAGGFFFLLLGVVDDLWPFRPAVKFVLQTVAATAAVGLGLGYPWTGWVLLDVSLTVLWIVTLVNAVNFIDVCDGLVGGLAVLLFLFLAHGTSASPALPLALAGAAAGFLVFNLPPARIFLGDAGSLSLGFLLAALVLPPVGETSLWPALAVMLLSMAVPLFELVFITTARLAKGLPWWRGSPDHFALRLQAAGWSRLQAALAGWGAALLGCVCAEALPRLSAAGQALVLSAAAAVAVLCWYLLWRCPIQGETIERVVHRRNRNEHGASFAAVQLSQPRR